MAVSQNIARLRALLQGLAVTGVKSLGLQLLQLESTEAVSAGGGVGDVTSTSLSTTTLVSIVTTTALSGSVTLAAGNSTGQLKYVILGTQGSSQKLKLSCSAGTGGTALTASLNIARTGLGLIYDGTNWQLLNPNTGSSVV